MWARLAELKLAIAVLVLVGICFAAAWWWCRRCQQEEDFDDESSVASELRLAAATVVESILAEPEPEAPVRKSRARKPKALPVDDNSAE